MRRLLLLPTCAILLVMLSTGCGLVKKDEADRTDPTNGTGPVKNWALTMALSKNNFTMQQGATDTIIVTLTRTGGYTGAVTLTAITPGSGITVTFENITATGAVTTARAIVSVGGSYPPGNGVAFGIHAAPATNEVMGQNADVTFNVVRKPGIFVQLSSTLSVGRGQSGSVPVTLVRTDFDLPVSMSLVTTTAGLTASFSPNPVTGTTTQMTLNVDAAVAEGTYSVGIRANEGAPTQATAPLALTVTPAGSFALSFSVGTLLVPRGTTVPVGLNIARTNYPGPVTISITGVPNGATATFVSPASGNTLSITFNPGTALAGDYPILVTGMGTGAPNATASLTLRIGQ